MDFHDLHLSSYPHLDLKTIKVRLRKVSTSSHISRHLNPGYQVLSPSHTQSPCTISAFVYTHTVHSIRPLRLAYLSCCHPLYGKTHEVRWVIKALGIQTNLGVPSCAPSPLPHCTCETIIHSGDKRVKLLCWGTLKFTFYRIKPVVANCPLFPEINVS